MENVESFIEETGGKEPFYTYRNIGKCLSAGISFITDNITPLLKLFFPIYLLDGLSMVLMNANLKSTDIYGLVLLVVGIVLFIANNIMRVGMLSFMLHLDSINKTFNKYNAWTLIVDSRKHTKRMLLFFLIFLCVCVITFLPVIAVIYFLYKTGHVNIAYYFVLMYVAMLIFLLLVPSATAMFYAVMENGSTIKNTWTGFKNGYKYWGKNFGVEIIAGLLVFLITTFLNLPAFVMSEAQLAAQASISTGESVTLPSIFTPMFLVTTFVTGILTSLISLLEISIIAHLYASIKTSEKDSTSILKIDELS